MRHAILGSPDPPGALRAGVSLIAAIATAILEMERTIPVGWSFAPANARPRDGEEMARSPGSES